METSEHSPSVLALQAGQSVHLDLAAGASLVLLRGVAEVQGPAGWLAGTVLRSGGVLREGQGYAMPQDGTLQLRASAACKLVVLRRTTAWMRLTCWLRQTWATRPAQRSIPALR